MLGLDDEIHRPLGWLAKPLVAGHGIGLAQDDRRLAVGVHPADSRPAQVAIGSLLPDQPSQPLGDFTIVVPLGRRVAGAEKRKQGQGRPGYVAHLAYPLGRASGLGGQVKGVQAPTAVGVLVPGKPLEPGRHGGFRLRGPAFAFDDLRPDRQIASGQRAPSPAVGRPLEESEVSDFVSASGELLTGGATAMIGWSIFNSGSPGGFRSMVGSSVILPVSSTGGAMSGVSNSTASPPIPDR